MTPGMREKSPPAIDNGNDQFGSQQPSGALGTNSPQKPFTTAKATRGPIVTANGQIASVLTVTMMRQSKSELRLPRSESAKSPNAIRPPADERL